MDKMERYGLKNSAFGGLEITSFYFLPKFGSNHDREVRSNITFIINKVNMFLQYITTGTG